MGGILHFIGQKPEIGSEVLIVVDSVNSPTGTWLGQLVDAGEDHRRYEGDTTSSSTCVSLITDERIKQEKFFRKHPTSNYNVYQPHAAMHHLLRTRTEDRAEISALKKRLEIERSVFHGALKAMVSDKGFDKLEALLESFLERLEEKLGR